MVRLSHYFGNAGDPPPEVQYIPNPNPSRQVEGYLSAELIIANGVALGTAAYKAPDPIDAASIEKKGVKLSFNIPPNEGFASVQKMWAFAPMTNDDYQWFVTSMEHH